MMLLIYFLRMNAWFLLELIHSINCFILLTGVPTAGAVDHLLPHQMLGVLPLCLQILMVVLVHQAISVAALHLVEVALDLQLRVVIELMNLLLMHGVQIQGHHQLLEH